LGGVSSNMSGIVNPAYKDWFVKEHLLRYRARFLELMGERNWHNFRTGELDSQPSGWLPTEKEGMDYIPQTRLNKNRYLWYLTKGLSPLDAMETVLIHGIDDALGRLGVFVDE